MTLFSDSLRALRRLRSTPRLVLLLWGAHLAIAAVAFFPVLRHLDTALAKAESLLVERGVLKSGDTYAITCGEPMGYPGGTNMLKVCRVA